MSIFKMRTNKNINQVPLGDKGIFGERDDMLDPQRSGRRGVYEHLQRYRLTMKKIGPNKKVLDLGCGTGYGSRMLYGAGSEVYGIDVSQGAIDYAKKKYSGPKYVCCSAEKTPFQNNFFDVVTAFEVIEHVQNPEKVLREIYRVLKNGGDLFISTPNPRHLLNTIKHLFRANPYPEKVNAKNIYHIKEFYYDEFIEFLKRGNFKIISQYGQTLSILPGKIEALLDKLPLFYKIPIFWGYFFPKYAWTIVIHVQKKIL